MQNSTEEKEDELAAFLRRCQVNEAKDPWLLPGRRSGFRIDKDATYLEHAIADSDEDAVESESEEREPMFKQHLLVDPSQEGLAESAVQESGQISCSVSRLPSSHSIDLGLFGSSEQNSSRAETQPRAMKRPRAETQPRAAKGPYAGKQPAKSIAGKTMAELIRPAKRPALIGTETAKKAPVFLDLASADSEVEKTLGIPDAFDVDYVYETTEEWMDGCFLMLRTQ